MPLQCGLKHSPCSTEWIDVYYKHTYGNIIILWNHSFPMISMRNTKSMPIENGQLSKTGYESCLLYYMVTSIEQKVFTFKHGVNIGRSICQLVRPAQNARSILLQENLKQSSAITIATYILLHYVLVM